jgi:hypothetical protein
MTPLALLVVVFIFLAFGLVRTQLSARRLAGLSWEDLLAKLEPVETDGITAVAVELNPRDSQAGMKPEHIWKMIGRAEGLSLMRANSEVLIALGTYAQRWNLDEGTIVAEQMRRDGWPCGEPWWELGSA